MAKAIEVHKPCFSCRSSDALSIYEDDKGKRFWKCFSCNESGQMNESVVENRPISVSGKVAAIPERDITKDTCNFFGVLSSDTEVRFPYSGGYKVRKREEKQFFQEGKPSGLFGQDKFPAGGKYVTITEGEYDALAAFQMLGSRYPVVSIRNGAGSAFKEVSEAFEWLDSFDNIVVCFDSDEPGKEAARKVAELFSHKSLVVKLNKFKDANEYLMQQASKEFIDSWWRAEKFTPDGIIQGATMWDRINKPAQKADVLYPFDGVNRLTYGIRKGELVTITAGSGLGKSQFLREITWNILSKTGDNIGLMFLEESTEKTALGLMSLAANKPLYLPDCDATEEERKQAFDATLGSERVFLFDHFGSTGVDNIVNRVRYLAKARKCGFILLDHISIIVSAQEQGDERKAIDEIMTKLRMVVQETNIALICVSHLKRPDGKGHEEGAATSLAQLRGSGSIAQLSDIVIGLERNGQADDEVERNTTKIRVLKNRFSGLTGPAGAALYYRETGRMLEIDEEAI